MTTTTCCGNLSEGNTQLTEIETIAKGSGIHELKRLRKSYGSGNWKKMKGIAHIQLKSGKSGWPSFIGMSLMVLAKRKLNAKDIWSKP